MGGMHEDSMTREQFDQALIQITMENGKTDVNSRALFLNRLYRVIASNGSFKRLYQIKRPKVIGR